MLPTHNSESSQIFTVCDSLTVYRLEQALQLLVLICIVQIIDWPYVLLFVLLFILLGGQFFNNLSTYKLYGEACQIQILDNPVAIRWITPEGESSYSGEEIKILITRWFILLQLGQRKTKIRRLLFVDCFDNLESYSKCRKLLMRLNYAS